MLASKLLPRVFIHTDNNQKIALSDPNQNFSPEAVLNFYAHTYPVLTTAKIEGPEIADDTVQYKFISTIGTKG